MAQDKDDPINISFYAVMIHKIQMLTNVLMLGHTHRNGLLYGTFDGCYCELCIADP